MDNADPVKFLLASLLVLGLLALMAVALRFLRDKPWMGLRVRGQGGNARLSVSETLYIDARRKCVLLRRDDTEHLLLLADGRELVVESNIMKKDA